MGAAQQSTQKNIPGKIVETIPLSYRQKRNYHEQIHNSGNYRNEHVMDSSCLEGGVTDRGVIFSCLLFQSTPE
ncbi:hypothetical protein CIH63_17525 [Salmonella enterica]|nr:hypothetical protein [Salmonella enterica]EBO9451467.1 hypothetical protein [Salmonella enterica]EBT4615351.1 hypothetical protein [Salmonella enterica]EDJ0354946.1 hypothetical protein [Salmonella enterica]EJF3712178.1 hypothetical protein [Salmonella enterica]